MSERYRVTKDGKDLESIYVEAVLSSMHTPIVPMTTITKGSTHYKKFDSDFNIFGHEKETIFSGKISNDLANRLKEYGLELIKCKGDN